MKVNLSFLILDVATTFLVTPLMISEAPGATFDNLHGNSLEAKEFKKKVYANPNFHGLLKNVLVKYELKGLLAHDSRYQ